MTSMAQSVELIRIYTDKDCYLAGEKLWIKLCLDDEAFPGNVMSRVAYVEICDTAQVCAQAKIALEQGTGWACIQLPSSMHSGMYQLTAYTRYMRNLNSDCFPRKYVAVLNTLGTSEDDRLVINDSVVFPKTVFKSFVGNKLLEGDKVTYGFREKVSLKLDSRLAEAKELVLSVVRKDCEVNMSQPEVTVPRPANGERWVAECEGHIVTGKMKGDKLLESVSTQLSCMGKEINVFEGKSKGNGTYNFYTYGVNGQQDIVLSALDDDEQPCRMEIVTPFVEQLPQHVPNLYCQYEESDMIARSVALQLTRAMPKTIYPKALDEVVYGQLPSRIYNLDEYVRFNVVKECIIEFIKGVTFDKEGHRTVIKMFQENNRGYSMLPVLVLVDGIAFYDHSEVLGYNARNVHYIHQYRGNYTLGKTMYGGILSLITHRGTLPDIRLNSNMQMLSYEFPQDRPAFEMPNYNDEERKASRQPDFRHTMYWNPSVIGKTEVEFYTSDLEGIYVATLQGVDADGKRIEINWEFEVR
jgi:hypothetical protein